MISIDTPAGTSLVVTWVAKTAEEAASVAAEDYRDAIRDGWEDGSIRSTLEIGQRFILKAIVWCDAAMRGYAVVLEGRAGMYPAQTFTVAEDA